MFAPLADEERGGPFWEGFWPSVRAGLTEADSGDSGFLVWLRRPAFAWAAAAAIVVVSVLAFTRPWEPGPSTDSSTRAPQMADLQGGAEDDLWPLILASGPAGEPVLPTVQEVRSPSASILSMRVYGEDQAVTEVVLIVDEEMEL